MSLSFPFLYIFNSFSLLLLFHFAKLVYPVKETQRLNRDQATIWQKLGLVWKRRKKISQIIKDYFYLPFFLLTILCQRLSERSIGYLVFVLLILRGWQIYVEKLFYCGVDKTQRTPHSRQSTKLSRQSSELGLPHSVLTSRRVGTGHPPAPPPPGCRGVGTHSLGGVGVEGSNEGTYTCGTLGIYVLADRKYHVCHNYSIRRLG